jgi:septum formation protein
MPQTKRLELPFPVILASASPRRIKLLSALLENFEIVPADIEEEHLLDSDPWITVQKTAREKALSVFEKHPDSLVIAGDTLVAIPKENSFEILGKPKDEAEGRAMLEKLASQEHLVITGIAVRCPLGFSAFTETSTVTYKKLTDSDIDAYIRSGEYKDKAGAYCVDFCKTIKGSIDNIHGLPIDRLRDCIKELLKK